MNTNDDKNLNNIIIGNFVMDIDKQIHKTTKEFQNIITTAPKEIKDKLNKVVKRITKLEKQKTREQNKKLRDDLKQIREQKKIIAEQLKNEIRTNKYKNNDLKKQLKFEKIDLFQKIKQHELTRRKQEKIRKINEKKQQD